ncbi:MAG: LGFP repeat-containing protein [Mycobacterium sp.]
MTRVGNRLGRTFGRLTLGFVATAAAAALAIPSALASPESDASDAINGAWNAAGGGDSVVGGKDGDVYQVGVGYGQKFTDGQIFFTPETGAHLIYGAILDKYQSLGGPADSDLGFPNIDEVAGLVGPKSRVSTFNASDKPAIFWTPDTGAWAVRGAINAAWDKLGGSAGTLGVPVEDERYDGDLVRQKFTGGEISWNRVTNSFTTDPAGLADSLAGLEVPLDPTTLINLAWRADGGLGGPLGARQGEQSKIGDAGAAQGYAGGKIFYSPETGAHAVTGAILSKYESADGPTGDLGYPVGTEADGGVPNSRVSAFSATDKPVIFWTPDSGAIIIRGAINAAWAKLGGATGTLGVPTGEQTVKGDTVTQTFSGGEISWDKATKEFSTKPAELASELKGLEMPDAVSQAPTAPGPGSETTKEKGGWGWWWLLIAIPLLLLLGLLATRGRRKAVPEREVPRQDYGRESEDDHWPGTRSREESRLDNPWSAPVTGEDDEDAIDTAPTRVPTETELAEVQPETTESDDWFTPLPDLGRHSAGTAEGAWRMDLGEIGTPHRRHAVEEITSWTAEVEEVVEVEPIAERGDWDRGDWDRGGEPAAEEPWRPAIHLPLADPYQPPEGYYIKGNTHSGLYYTPDSALYDNTIPEVWFASEELAQANGFVKAPE